MMVEARVTTVLSQTESKTQKEEFCYYTAE